MDPCPEVVLWYGLHGHTEGVEICANAWNSSLVDSQILANVQHRNINERIPDTGHPDIERFRRKLLLNNLVILSK